MTTSTPKKGPVPPANWQERFLATLSKAANVSAATKAARVSRNFVYTQRGADPVFAAAWQEALTTAVEGLEQEAWRRAATGVQEPVYQGGKRVGYIRKYSDTLLIFLLKAHAPDRYRETLNVTVNIRREAERLAAAYGLEVEDVIAEAERILAESA